MADGKVKIDVILDEGDAEKKLDGIEGAAEDAGEGLKDMANGAEEGKKGLGAVDVAAGTLVANGITALLGGLKDMAVQMLSLADETREYREDMAKLDTAFTTAGYSTDTANEAYSSFYKILGESDRSVEAVNHLAELTKNEEELAKWSTIAAGVTAKFGDSLPIEGLTEAANETAKVGQVTGPLADALNWVGISEDEFNKKLEACNSEQERATLITNTLNNEYAAAAEEYNKLTANTQAARDATNNMEQAQAALGAAIEPVTTAWTNMKAQALSWLVDTGLPALRTGWQWVIDNVPTIVGLVGTLTAAWLTFGGAQKVVDTWNKVIAISQAALNAVMNANPIGLIITLIALLVTAFITLWNNCEGFRQFWINLWENIKAWCSQAWEDIKGWFSSAWEFIKGIWNGAKDFFAGIWEGITEVFASVGAWFAEKFEAAKEAIQNAWSSVVEWFSNIWSGITGVFSSVGTWFKDKFNSAVEGIKNAWASIKQWFTQTWENIKGVFSKAKDDFLSIGKNIVDGIKQGIKEKWDNLKQWFSDLFGDLKSIAKKILGIESPSKEFAWIGEMTTAGLEKGIKHGGAKAVEAVTGVGAEMLKAAKKSADKQVKALEAQLDRLEEIRTEKNKKTIDAQKKQVQKELENAKERQKAVTTFANTYEKQLSELLKLEEDYNKAHQDIFDRLASDSEKAVERYQSTFDSRVASIRNSLGIFDEVEKKDAVSRWDMTKALSSQVKELERYNEALSRLWGREGVSAAFYEEFSQLGVDYLPQLEAINKMTDTELARYVELWEEKTALAAEAATKELAGERGRLDAELRDIQKDAQKEADVLKTEYNGKMLELLGEIAAGMLNAGEAGIEALGETVTGYVEAGAALMEGVAEGMESKQSEIINQAVSAVRAALAAAREEADINSPSRATRDEIGAPLAEGVAVGWHDKLSALQRSMQDDMSGLTERLRATVSSENARFGYSAGSPDTGFSELARAVNVQTAGINSLASSTRAGNTRPIVLMLDERELGHAFVDVGNTERARVGTRLVTGGAV